MNNNENVLKLPVKDINKRNLKIQNQKIVTIEWKLIMMIAMN